MAKKIKIIDLLNKIARGEELPQKIKYEVDILKYYEGSQDYYRMLANGGLEDDGLFEHLFTTEATESFINDTVEIIEEQEDIDIQNLEETEIKLDKDKSEEYYEYKNRIFRKRIYYEL